MINTYKEKRLKANLTQEQAESVLQISQGAISQWETGRTRPRAELLPKLAALYGCTIDELLRGDENEPREGA